MKIVLLCTFSLSLLTETIGRRKKAEIQHASIKCSAIMTVYSNPAPLEEKRSHNISMRFSIRRGSVVKMNSTSN